MRLFRYAIPLIAALILLIDQPLKADPTDINKTDEKRCLALTIYWEAMAEGRKGMIAVAWVVLNRVKSPKFPNTLCEVVLEGGEAPGCQFSYWCDGKGDEPQDQEIWELANEVAKQMLTEPPEDPTHGALFYHSEDLPVPWKIKRQRTAKVKGHIYYR
jgi:spore germination cell wall hydrolase CwlJ-like protein